MVTMIDSTALLTQLAGPGEFQCPCGVALNSRGDIYVCDLDNKRIQILDNNGKYLRQFGRPGTHQGALHVSRGRAPGPLTVLAGDWTWRVRSNSSVNRGQIRYNLNYSPRRL